MKRILLVLLVQSFVLTGGMALAQYSSPVRDVENPAHSPLRIRQNITFDAGFGGVFGVAVGPAIAADRRFVIEYASVMCGVTSVDPARLWIFVTEKKVSGSTQHSYLVPMSRTPVDVYGTVSSFGALTHRMYHDGGNTVQIGAYFTGAVPAGGMACTVELSGYTVIMP